MQCTIWMIFSSWGPAESTTCQRDLTTTLTTCVDLGFPVAPEKTEGPTTRLTFLGIEIDSGASQIRLPQEKLVALQATVSQWMNKAGSRSSCKKRDLLSLIGLLQHATAVVRPGRAFDRSLIDAASTVQHPDHWVHLNLIARSDIAWWHTFVQAWNGVSLMPFPQPSRYMTSDASGSWGCGAAFTICGSRRSGRQAGHGCQSHPRSWFQS